ncbi:uncharacterized protein LOC125249483 [Megalobrama amblycephala]|uniref:uncharacterized protein LOC125249483 n=1 Tax=Megalobrama amblycephala TaxID=75352 RepID=UPI0020140EAB|nr:uncharacterized protein LOC125249483 [Megalobrama amblycephala]
MLNYIDLFHNIFQFSTDKRPESRKWKEALERIDACPLQRGNKVDLFRRHIVCTCGFHKSTDKEGPNVVAGGSSEEAGTSQGEQGVKCSLCSVVVETEKFSEHLSDHHAEERCDTCGARGQGAVGLLQHSPTIMGPCWLHVSALQKISHHLHAPHHLHGWCHLHSSCCLHCLHHATLQLSPPRPTPSPRYFRQRMFLWAPMWMWGIPLKCSQCGRKMHHSGIYPKVREVINTTYYATTWWVETIHAAVYADCQYAHGARTSFYNWM